MVGTLGPVAEAVFALHSFGQQRGARAAQWRKQTRQQLGDDLADIRQVHRDYRVIPDLLWLLQRPGDTVDLSRAEARRLAAVTFVFCRAAVLPYWSRIQAHLEAERDVRGRMAVTNGMECLLTTLSPRVGWRSPVLEIAADADVDISLDGRGLILSPSLFLADKTCVFIESEKQTGLPALVFSLPGDPYRIIEPDEDETAGDRALGALVGATRAAALRALTRSGTTGDLSERLGISLSGASKHATVLREAGLITTVRNCTTALHTLTPLGMALLQSKLPAGPHGNPAMVGPESGAGRGRSFAPTEKVWSGGVGHGTVGGEGLAPVVEGRTGVAVVEMRDDERRRIGEVAAALSECCSSAATPDLLREGQLYAHELPMRLRRALMDFRTKEPCGTLVVRALDIDQAALGPTPDRPGGPSAGNVHAHDMALLMVVSLLGEPIDRTGGDGFLMQDVSVMPHFGDGAMTPVGAFTGAWGVGDVSDPVRADYLALLCLRNPDGVEAAVTDVADVKVDDELYEMLSARYPMLSDELRLLQAGGRMDTADPALVELLRRSREQFGPSSPAPALASSRPSNDALARPGPGNPSGLHDAEQRMVRAIARAVDAAAISVVLQPGDICLIDNARVVSARESFQACFDGDDRWFRSLAVARMSGGRADTGSPSRVRRAAGIE